MSKQATKAQPVRQSTFTGRDSEQPVPMVRKRQHALEPGMVCEHISTFDERWTITVVTGFWCRAKKGRGKDEIEQSFPCDALLPVIDLDRKTTEPVIRTKATEFKAALAEAARGPRKPRASVNHDIAQRLKDADSLDDMWAIAYALGLPSGTRDKLTHLNPGLQRINAGNRLRALAKAGQLKPVAAAPKPAKTPHPAIKGITFTKAPAPTARKGVRKG